MLSFGFSPAFWLALSLVPIAFFYFLRMRFRRRPIGSSYIWSRLKESTLGGNKLRRRSILLLVLQIFAAVFAVLAATEPYLVSKMLVKPGVVYLVDVSASMGSTDVAQSGKKIGNRLDAAAGMIREEIGKLPPDVPVQVFACASGISSLASPEDGGAKISSILEALKPTGESFLEGEVSDALKAWLSTQDRSWRARLFTDGGLDLGGRSISSVFGNSLEVTTIGDRGRNCGILSLNLENGDNSTGSAKFLVRNGWETDRSLAVSLIRDGNLLGKAAISAPPGLSSGMIAFPGKALPGAYLLKIENAEDDLPADDIFRLAVNEPRRVSVLFVGEESPFLRAALAQDKIDYAVLPEFPENFSSKDWDLIISNGALIPPGLRCDLFSFGSVPADAPVRISGNALGSLASEDESHPVARFSDWSGIGGLFSLTFKTGNGVRTLASIEGKPVLVAWENEGYRSIACGIDASNSDFGMSGAFPVLMRNAFQWFVPETGGQSSYTLVVGVGTLRAEPESWKILDTGKIETIWKGARVLLKAKEPGVFRWERAKDSGFLAANIAADETETEPRQLRSGHAAPNLVSSFTGREIPFGAFFAAGFLALLALEWRVWRAWPERLAPKKKPGGEKKTKGRIRIFLILRGCAMACAALALVGVSIALPTKNRNIVLLFDVSDSMGKAIIEDSRKAAIDIVRSIKPGDRAAAVAFSGGAKLLFPLQSRAESLKRLNDASLSAPVPDATDLKTAILIADELIARAGGDRSIVLFSDGLSNSGGALTAVNLSMARIPLRSVPLGRKKSGLYSEGLEIPEVIHPGENVIVDWKVESSSRKSILAEIRIDGKLVERRKAELAEGANSLAFGLGFGSSGDHEIEIKAFDPDGILLSEASSGGIAKVGGKAKILLIRGSDRKSPISGALGAQGMNILESGIEGLPETSSGYGGVSAVVLDNVPALFLGESQQIELQNYVLGGGGLLVVGGDVSLGRGEYYATPLEDMLPVETDTRRRLFFTRAKILFVIDHSGSMSEAVGARTKQATAMEGTAAALDEMNPQDEIGILTFDSEATWVLPFTPASRTQEIKRSLATMPEGGGTDMSKAFEEVIRGFGSPGPTKRHMILMTDGQTPEADFKILTDRLKAIGVTITTIGIGETVNEALLKDIANWNDGLYYRAVLDDIPSIVKRETVRVTRDLIQEGRFLPLMGTEAGPLEGLRGAFPALTGYLIVKAKKQASVLLEAENPKSQSGRDPLFAYWKYGNGKVAVFASDSGARWISSWVGLPSYNRFWSQGIRAIERATPDSGLRVQARMEGSAARITVEAIGSDRKLRTGLVLTGRDASNDSLRFSLSESVPGFYEAYVPASGFGLKRFEIFDRQGGSWSTGWTWNPIGYELSRLGPDPASLGLIVSSTGGSFLDPEKPRLPEPRSAWRSMPIRIPVLILATLFLLMELYMRSAGLGQMTMAKAMFLAWWADRLKALEALTLPGAKEKAETATDDGYTKTMDAYLYLAMRAREKAAAKAEGENDEKTG